VISAQEVSYRICPEMSADWSEGDRHPGPDPGSSLWNPAFAGMTEKTTLEASRSFRKQLATLLETR